MRDAGSAAITPVVRDDFSPGGNGSPTPPTTYVIVTEDGLHYIGLENDSGIIALE